MQKYITINLMEIFCKSIDIKRRLFKTCLPINPGIVSDDFTQYIIQLQIKGYAVTQFPYSTVYSAGESHV